MRSALLLLAAAAAALGETPEEKAEELWREWRRLGRGRLDRERFEQREHVLFALRDLPGEAGRPFLFKVLGDVRRPDESVLAITFLGPVRDLDHLDQVVGHVAKTRNEVMIRVLGEQLQRTASDDVKRWVREKGLASRDKVVLGTMCRGVIPFMTAEIEEALERLWPSYARRRSDRIAFEAVRALGFLHKQLRRPVLPGAYGHSSLAVRLGAAEALAGVSDPDAETRERIGALLRDPEWRVRKALLELAGWSKNESLAAELIEALEQDPRLTCRYAARASLRELAGRDLEYDAAAWREWLRDRQAEVTVKPGGYTFARYYGHQIVSDNICFVVDLSGSMRKGGRGTTRIEVARKELVRALEQLDPKTRFNVVVFSDEAEAWSRRNGVVATPRNVERAKEWIDETFVPKGQTNTYDALRLAFEHNPDLDTIFLLSDGSPTVSDYESRTGILAAVYAWNWERRVTIHTIALSLSELIGKTKTDWGENFMESLARFTRGECRIVTEPPE